MAQGDRSSSRTNIGHIYARQLDIALAQFRPEKIGDRRIWNPREVENKAGMEFPGRGHSK